MIKRALLVLLMLVFVAPAVSQELTSADLDAMRAAIQGTKVNEASKLTGRNFILKVPGAAAEKTLIITVDGLSESPVKIERTGPDTFLATVMDGPALLTTDPIREFRTMRAQYAQDIPITFGANITGQGACRYSINFEQVGGDALDLTALSAFYKASWNVTNPTAVSNVRIEGAGLALERSLGAGGPVQLSLTLVSNDGKKTYRSAPIEVPSCIPGDIKTEIKYETQTLRTNVVHPNQCLISTPESVASCDVCGPLNVRLSSSYYNSCEKTVQCDAKAELYVPVAGNKWLRVDSNAENDVFWVASKQNYQITRTLSHSQYVTPFMTKGIIHQNCKYRD